MKNKGLFCGKRIAPRPVHFHAGKLREQERLEEYNSVHRRNFLMNVKRILSMLAIGALSAWTAAAQTSASAQAGASAQSQNSVQASKSGGQASGSGSAATSASGNAGNKSASISNGTNIDATLTNSLDAKKSKPGDEVEARA